MAKMNALKAHLDAAAGKKEPEPVEAAPKATRATSKPPSRKGLVHVGAWLPKDYSKHILLLRAKTGLPVKTIFAKALNDMFQAHGIAVIDDE